jgi:hypothetical protein
MRKAVAFLFAVAVVSCSSNAEHSTAVSIPAQACTHANGNQYTWLSKYDPQQSVCSRIAPPAGFERIKLAEGSFADWLRHMPLKPQGAEVHLYNGKLKGRQDVHAAVIDIDPGDQDLQQCADAVMRLRGEYLYSKKSYDALHFNFTSGDKVGFRQWSEGYRPKVKGNRVSMVKTAGADESYKSFRSYMNSIFMYSGTISLSKEMKAVSDVKSLMPGDVFIMAGSPGHAMIVADAAENPVTKEKIFLLAQSYMPAQEMHIVKNLGSANLGPWYSADIGGELQTPEWTFDKNNLERFEDK